MWIRYLIYGIVLLGLAVNWGVYTCFGLPAFTKLIGLEGLVLDAIGASVIALPEISTTRKLLAPAELRNIREQLVDNPDPGEPMRKGDAGFDKLVQMVKAETDRLDDDEVPVRIGVRLVDSFGEHPIASSTDPDSRGYDVTTSPELERWIETRIDNHIGRSYIRFGFVALALGFILQIIAYLINNLVLQPK